MPGFNSKLSIFIFSFAVARVGIKNGTDIGIADVCRDTVFNNEREYSSWYLFVKAVFTTIYHFLLWKSDPVRPNLQSPIHLPILDDLILVDFELGRGDSCEDVAAIEVTHVFDWGQKYLPIIEIVVLELCYLFVTFALSNRCHYQV